MTDSKTTLPSYEATTSTHVTTTRIRNGRTLLATTIQMGRLEQLRYNGRGDADTDRDDDDASSPFISIEPVGQLAMVEARSHDVSSFNVNADLLVTFGEGRNRWLDYKKVPCEPPAPLRVPKLVMSPGLCMLWYAQLYRISPPEAGASSSGDLPLTSLIIVQGTAGAERRKFMAVESFHEAVSTILHELANGFSVVFVGVMLKTEFENRMLAGKAYQICRSVDELKHWQKDGLTMIPSRPTLGLRSVSHSRLGEPERDARLPKDKDKDKDRGKDLSDEPRRYLGIIC